MKVKKRQYRSKRGRPLKKSKAKSKAKKGSKRRVKKMRGGDKVKFRQIDFYWNDNDNIVATFYGEIKKGYAPNGVIIVTNLCSNPGCTNNEFRQYFVTSKLVGKDIVGGINDDFNSDLFKSICGVSDEALKVYNTNVNRYSQKKLRSTDQTYMDSFKKLVKQQAYKHLPEDAVLDIPSESLTELSELTPDPQYDTKFKRLKRHARDETYTFIWD
jgi:hypothetical protein